MSTRTALFARKQSGGVFNIEDQSRSTGNRWFLGNDISGNTDSASFGRNPDAPFATLDYAISQMTINNGDILYIMPGHAETIATATALDFDKAGIQVEGLGYGADRPTFTVNGVATATITVSAASVKWHNCIVIGGLDGLNTAITVTGADCDLDLEYRDTSATVEADIAMAITGDRPRVRLRDIGFTAGDQRDQSITLNGVDNARIDIDFFGKVATAVVDLITAASTDVQVRGVMYVSGTTDGSKNVVDTIGGSSWYMDVVDAAAGARYTGGSAAAVGSDDISGINTKIGTITNTGGTATIGGVLGDVSNVSVATSLAKIGTLTNTGGTATIGGILGDVNNVTVATSLAKIGTLTNTGGTATLGGILGDVANVSVATNLAKIGTLTNTGGTATLGGILGDVANVTVATNLAKIGTITNTGGTATIGGVLGDVSNVSIATSLAKIGTLTNTGGTATLGGILGDVANVDIATSLAKLGTLVNTGGTATLGGMLGDFANKTLAYRTSASTRVSIVTLAAADMTGTTTRWTITDGPILVKRLGMLITTVLPAGANTLLFSFTPTGGGATDLCAATDTASAAAQQLFMVDGVKVTVLDKTTDVGIAVLADNANMPIVLGSGIVQTIFSAGPPASGAAVIFMEWEPMNTATVVA